MGRNLILVALLAILALAFGFQQQVHAEETGADLDSSFQEEPESKTDLEVGTSELTSIEDDLAAAMSHRDLKKKNKKNKKKKNKGKKKQQVKGMCVAYNAVGESCRSITGATRNCCKGGLSCNSNGVCVEPTSILFLGNSFTIRNNLVGMFRQLANAGKNGPIVIGSNLIPAATLSFHSRNSQATWTKLYSRGSWTYLVLQEQSQFLSKGSYYAQTKVLPYARELVEGAISVDAQTILYETWGYRFGDWGTQLNDDYYQMQQRIIDGYTSVESSLSGSTSFISGSSHAKSERTVVRSPVGEAWRSVFDQYKGTNGKILYDLDGRHPSPKGSYLAACTLYATIFKKSPVGLNVFPKGVNKALARKLQIAAAKATGLL